MVKAVKAGEAQAHARVYDQLPDRGIPVSLRDAQLVLAREYGYNGWTELKVEILKRSGNGLAWAAHEGVQAIHANDVERLRQLITEYPELLSWRDSDADGEVLLQATTSYANFPGAETFIFALSYLTTQVRLLEVASFTPNSEAMITAILDRDPAVLHVEPPPESPAVSYAIEYGNAGYVADLARLWPVPDSLPHAAGLADWPNLRRWFNPDGTPRLGDLNRHNPFPSQDTEVTTQAVLDRALAWAVQNGEYEVADFMLERGADINTRWSTHEPASLMHECVTSDRIDQAKSLLSRGYDVTIKDHRFGSTAEGWARYGGHQEMVDLLAAATR